MSQENNDLPSELHYEEDPESKEVRKAALEEALSLLSNDTKNQILLQAIKHFPKVESYRDQLIVRVGELDKTFGEWVLKKAEEQNSF